VHHIFRSARSGSFNITPVIDIVFILIIFFLVVCQFVEAENFPVTVPDQCDAAQNEVEPALERTTVTVMETDSGGIDFAVGPQVIHASDYKKPVEMVPPLAGMIDGHLRDMPGPQKIVTLRADKNIEYGYAQYALAAIAQSTATDVQLAVVKGELQSDLPPDTN
jgi:biopolymer transport protein ExbD